MRRWDARQPGSASCKLGGAGSPVQARYVIGGAERIFSSDAVSYDEREQALRSAPMGPLKEYEDKLKAIELCSRGLDKSSVAELLGRSEHWVKRWWRKSPETVPKPDVRHSPLVNNAPLSAFRDLELIRGFADTALDRQPPCEESIFDALFRVAEWQPARRATRDPDTGKLKLRFDAAGKSMTQSKRHVARYQKGMLSKMDSILEHMFAAANINDTRAQIFMNYYEDGAATCPSHRHDFWTCMLSFGADRVAIIEDQPFMLRDGDLLIFGTQSHSLPVMPDLGAGRISVVVFYRPEASSIERRWATLDLEVAKVEDNDQEGADVPNTIAGSLVDIELLGCPGISLGFYSRCTYFATAPVDIYTIGCGCLSEADFFGALRPCNVNEIWDLRCSTTRSADHWSVDALRRACSGRIIRYMREPLGRNVTKGIENHVRSEEGHDILARIVQAASCDRVVAVLGEDLSLQACRLRKVVADELCSGRYGPVSVYHLSREAIVKHACIELERVTDTEKLESLEGNITSETKPCLDVTAKCSRARVGRWR